jgi:hypothetical protein
LGWRASAASVIAGSIAELFAHQCCELLQVRRRDPSLISDMSRDFLRLLRAVNAGVVLKPWVIGIGEDGEYNAIAPFNTNECSRFAG